MERDATRRALSWLRQLKEKGIDITGSFPAKELESQKLNKRRGKGPITARLAEAQKNDGVYRLHESLASALEDYCATTPMMRQAGGYQTETSLRLGQDCNESRCLSDSRIQHIKFGKQVTWGAQTKNNQLMVVF